MGLGRYMDGCGSCMKYSLFFVNLLIFIGGLVVIGLGIYIAVDRSFGTELLGTNLYIGTIYVLIAAAVVVALIACFGCFGAAQEVRCMLMTYFIILFLIFIVTLVGGILLYVFRHKVETTMRNGLQSSLHSYNTSKEARESWNELQKSLECCGITDYRDWRGDLPSSCCKPVNNVLGPCHQSNPNLFTKGCMEAWPAFLQKNAAIIGGVGIAVACIMVSGAGSAEINSQILGMVFSCALFNMID